MPRPDPSAPPRPDAAPARRGADPADLALVRRVLAGEREAFRPLVEKYQDAVYHAALRVLGQPEAAEDAAQESFLKAYRRLDRYDPRWALSTWLVTIATRTALNARRRQARSRELPAEALPAKALAAPPQDNPAARAQRNEWARRLARELAALGERARLVFALRYEDELPLRDIARATGQSEGAVKVLLHRTRRTLRRRLETESQPEENR